MILAFMGPPRGWALKKLSPFILKINENYDEERNSEAPILFATTIWSKVGGVFQSFQKRYKISTCNVDIYKLHFHWSFILFIEHFSYYIFIIYLSINYLFTDTIIVIKKERTATDSWRMQFMS